MILRCTRKLLAVLGSAVAEPAPAPDPEDWYANLVWLDRRKCLLLIHSATLAGAGGLARTDLPELNRSLRRHINSARGYRPPIELAARRLAV